MVEPVLSVVEFEAGAVESVIRSRDSSSSSIKVDNKDHKPSKRE